MRQDNIGGNMIRFGNPLTVLLRHKNIKTWVGWAEALGYKKPENGAIVLARKYARLKRKGRIDKLLNLRRKGRWLDIVREISVEEGHTATERDLRKRGVNPSALKYHFNSTRNWQRAAGLIPNPRGIFITRRKTQG